MAYLKREPPAKVKFVGAVARGMSSAESSAGAAVYVSASRREEYGTTQLEALADEVPLPHCRPQVQPSPWRPLAGSTPT